MPRKGQWEKKEFQDWPDKKFVQSNRGFNSKAVFTESESSDRGNSSFRFYKNVVKMVFKKAVFTSPVLLNVKTGSFKKMGKRRAN